MNDKVKDKETYLSLLKFVWPFFKKPLAKRVADYVQVRRARRLGLDQPDSAADGPKKQAAKPKGTAKLAVAFTSLGLLLGSAVGFIVAQFVDDEDLPQPIGQTLQRIRK